MNSRKESPSSDGTLYRSKQARLSFCLFPMRTIGCKMPFGHQVYFSFPPCFPTRPALRVMHRTSRPSHTAGSTFQEKLTTLANENCVSAVRSQTAKGLNLELSRGYLGRKYGRHCLCITPSGNPRPQTCRDALAGHELTFEPSYRLKLS